MGQPFRDSVSVTIFQPVFNFDQWFRSRDGYSTERRPMAAKWASMGHRCRAVRAAVAGAQRRSLLSFPIGGRPMTRTPVM